MQDLYVDEKPAMDILTQISGVAKAMNDIKDNINSQVIAKINSGNVWTGEGASAVNETFGKAVLVMENLGTDVQNASAAIQRSVATIHAADTAVSGQN